MKFKLKKTVFVLVMEEEFEEKFERGEREGKLIIFYQILPPSVSRHILSFFNSKELSILCLVSKTMNSENNPSLTKMKNNFLTIQKKSW